MTQESLHPGLGSGALREALTGTQVHAAVNECVDLHGIGQDFPNTWVDSNIDFNELAKAINKRESKWMNLMTHLTMTLTGKRVQYAESASTPQMILGWVLAAASTGIARRARNAVSARMRDVKRQPHALAASVVESG